MKTNTKVECKHYTHQGAPTHPLKPIDALRRSVMACMLWEKTFYEDGVDVAKRVEDLCGEVSVDDLRSLILEVYEKGLIRHMPLLMTVNLLKKKENKAADIIYKICTRPDQMGELLSLYWKDGRKPLPSQLKKGLAKAFCRFDEYQLSKWNRDNNIRLRDVLFLCHAKPRDQEQADLWKRLINGTLKTADTWETRLSSGADKKESFEELLTKNKMGLLAILMNLRNMKEAGISKALVNKAMSDKLTPMLPFKFVAAAMACPEWEDIIDDNMIKSIQLKPKILGHTHVFVDVSSSMRSKLSGKSELTMMEAACSFAMLLRECCEEVTIYSFSNHLVQILPRRGSALKDAIVKSQANLGTDLNAALNTFMAHVKAPYDRIIVITDEQINRAIPRVMSERKYILNVACYQNGIGHTDGWLTISGFSEASIDYIREIEGECKAVLH